MDINIIKKAIVDLDPVRREEALEAIQSQGAVVPFSEIRHLVADEDEFVRNTFIETVCVYGEEIAREQAFKCLLDTDEIVRINAAEVLLLFPPENLETLCCYLDDPEPLVRRTIAEIFGASGSNGEKYITLLKEKISQELNNQAKVGISFSLVSLGRARYLNDLYNILKSSDYHDRCSAARALADLFQKSCDYQIVSNLKAALVVEKTVAAREALVESLSRISAESAAERVRPPNSSLSD